MIRKLWNFDRWGAFRLYYRSNYGDRAYLTEAEEEYRRAARAGKSAHETIYIHYVTARREAQALRALGMVLGLVVPAIVVAMLRLNLGVWWSIGLALGGMVAGWLLGNVVLLARFIFFDRTMFSHVRRSAQNNEASPSS